MRKQRRKAKSHPSLRTQTRVMLFLPQQTDGHIRAFFDVIEYLKQQRRSKPIPVVGFNYSNPSFSGFLGGWWNPKKRGWEIESNTILTIDYPCLPDLSESHLKAVLARLKAYVAKAYKRHHVPQKEIWLTIQPIALV